MHISEIFCIVWIQFVMQSFIENAIKDCLTIAFLLMFSLQHVFLDNMRTKAFITYISIRCNHHCEMNKSNRYSMLMVSTSVLCILPSLLWCNLTCDASSRFSKAIKWMQWNSIALWNDMIGNNCILMIEIVEILMIENLTKERGL